MLHACSFRLGFSANETFLEKMRKFSFVFLKLFREILHFFAKMNKAKNEETKQNFAKKIFAKISHFRENIFAKTIRVEAV